MLFSLTQSTVSFRGSVNLDSFDVETLAELLVNARSQAIANTNSDLMLFVKLGRRLVQQVSAYFTHVGESRALVLDTIFPESGGAEFLSQYHCAA